MRKSTTELERLTPREWEVLALVREGLTNEQIAARLGISRDGAKYHVSEILGKLGVPDRIEAARWYDRSRREKAGFAGMVAAWFRRPQRAAGGQAVATAVIGVVVVGLLVLLAGVLVMQSRGGGVEEEVQQARRSGDERLDGLIDGLVSEDAAALRLRFGDVVARRFEPGTGEETVFSADEWSAMLAASSSRELYALLRGDPQQVPARDFDAVLRTRTDDGQVIGWLFAIDDYRVVEVVLQEDPSRLMPSVAGAYERFIVLPPTADLPQPPQAHAPSVRSGDAGVDAVLERLEAGDGAALAGLVAYESVPCGSDLQPFCDGAPQGTPVDALAVTQCGRSWGYEERSFIERRLGEIGGGIEGVHGVAALPEGYFPAGEHLVIVVVEDTPFRWQTNGLVLSEGRIVGLVNRCGEYPEQMYPAAAFVVAPPAGDPDPARRSGIGAIDAFLDAMAAGDVEAMESLVVYERIGCVTEQLGIGAPPLCADGEAEGTLVEAMPVAQCEGGYTRPQDFTNNALTTLAGWELALHAVIDLGVPDPAQQNGFGQGRYQVVLSLADTPEPPEPGARAISLFFSDEGLTRLWWGCGPSAPEDLFLPGLSPDWLLAP